MRRRREEDDDGIYEDYDGEEQRGSRRVRGRSNFIDDYAEEDGDDEDDYEEEEEEQGEEGFIVDTGTDLRDERVERRRYHDRRILEENDEDPEDLERRVQERYSRYHDEEYDEEATYVEQQALLPSIHDPTLWLVKCAVGHEREVAVCLMQNFIDRGSDLQIRSVVALDHLQNYIYVEADNEAHVKEAIKGMRNITANQKITSVPIKEMTDVVSVECYTVHKSKR